MKPKTGEDCIKMEESAHDPLDLVKQLVLLIVEARTPEFSAKGRVEGPHCPVISGGLSHLCAKDNEECLRAREFCRSATQLWTNRIPICIDILLFPDCHHGGEEVMVTEGAVNSMTDENVLLVERWMVASEKRRQDSGLGSKLLLQAVRSYLHFSQISSWLYSEKGKLPNLLAYRIYPPGEEASLNFLQTPDSHAFPFCVLRNDSIKVSVSAMQRVSQVPILLCASESHDQRKLCESESGAEGELIRGSKSKLMDKIKGQIGDLKAGQASDNAKKCHKEGETEAKNNFEWPKFINKKTTNQDYLSGKTNNDIKDNILRWTTNRSVMSDFEVTDFPKGKDPRKRCGTRMDMLFHKEILTEHKNGTEEKKGLYPEKSSDCTEEILKPIAHHGKKDGEIDQRIEQMKFAADLGRRMEKPKYKNSTNKMKPQETKNIMFVTKENRGDSFVLMDNEASQKEQFWTNFSNSWRGDFEKGQRAEISHFCRKEGEKTRLDERMEKSTAALCTKESFRKLSEWDMQMPLPWENQSSEMCSADEVERKSYPTASEAYKEDFIRQLSERIALVQTKPSVNPQPADIKALHFTSEKKNQDIKTRSGLDFRNVSPPERKDKFTICASQQDTLRSSEIYNSKSPSTKVTTTISGQSFQGLSDIGANEMSLGYKESNVCAKPNPPLSQLSVDISWSDFETEWDSDDTPTASPDQLSSARFSGSSLLKAVTARQMMGAVNTATNDLDKEDLVGPQHISSAVVEQKFESVIFQNSSPFKSRENDCYDSTGSKSSLANFEMQRSIQKDTFFHPFKKICQDEAESLSNKKIYSEKLSYRNVPTHNHVVRPQGEIRKTFEENLLPLASYDAQTDSFKMIDPNNQAKVLHSPKVLLSCDVPTEEAVFPEKGRCINFEEDINSELFISQLQEITPSQELPHGNVSYMSYLPDRSLKKEYKRDDVDLSKCNALTANKLNNKENKFSCLKNDTVYKPSKMKSQATKGLQDTVGTVKVASKERKHEREERTDLEKKKFCDQKEGIHHYEKDNESKLCGTAQSESNHSKLNSVSDTEVYCPSAPPTLQTFQPPSLSLSTSLVPMNYTPLSSLHSLQSLSASSFICSTPTAPSSLISLALDKCEDSFDVESRGWKDFKSLTDHGQTMPLENPTDDSLQSVFDFSTLDKEKLCCFIFDSDNHSSDTLLRNGKSYLNNSSLHHSTSQQPYKYWNNLVSDISVLASLSTVNAENQPHSGELNITRPSTQICDIRAKSSDHALTNTFIQKNCEVGKNNKLKTTISSNSDKVANCHSSLLLESFPEVDNHITFSECSSGSPTTKSESALKDSSYESTLGSKCCSADSTGTISNELCGSSNAGLRHPLLSSLSNPISPSLCGKMNKSHHLSDISDDIKGSSFSNLNAIDVSLQASQSLSFQTSCDNEGEKSLTFHLTNLDNDENMNLTSSTGIKLPRATISQFEDISIQQAISKNDLDVIACQTGTSEGITCKNQNKDNIPTASSSSERILINYSEHNCRCSHLGSHKDISLFETIGEPHNQSKFRSTEVKSENGLPMNNLLYKDANSSSQRDDSDPHVCHVSSKKQYPACYSFIEGNNETKVINHRELALSSAIDCTESGTSCDDSDDNEVFFYLDENKAPHIPKTGSTTHPSKLASCLMLSSTSCMQLDAPFSLISTAHTGKPSSLSTEAGMDLECSSNHDLNKGPFRRSRMASYEDNLPGWTLNPPHRSVSTPDCVDREVRGRGYQRSTCSRSASVLRQNDKDGLTARRAVLMSSSMIFNSRTALPTQSSPAPLKRKPSARFDYDASLLNVRAIKNAFSCSKLTLGYNEKDEDNEDKTRLLSTSAPASTNCLLGNFEESILNGRIDPVGTVDGFTAEIGASGSFCPKHLHLPVSAFFFALSDDNAPSPYLGHINLNAASKKGYHIPKKGTVQVTLFNPNKTVVKMFVVMYDLSDMPPSSQTFIRQRTMYIPTDENSTAPSYLRYLIHLRCSSSRSGKIYLHTDIRLIFARHKLEIDAKTVPYEMKSYTDVPRNPKYSPKK